MKLTRVVSTLVLSLFLGTTALIYAQDQRDDAKPEEARPEATKPAQDEAKPSKQDEAKPAKEEDKAAKQEEAKPSKQEEHAEKPAQNADHHAGRIPDDKFRAHFGQKHKFVISHPTIVEGQPRFQYGGYWFNIVDAWPVGWAYTDNCYIDYIDGEYFLFDLLHPGVRIALIVVL